MEIQQETLELIISKYKYKETRNFIFRTTAKLQPITKKKFFCNIDKI